MDKVISGGDNLLKREAFSDKFESFCRNLKTFISKLESINGPESKPVPDDNSSSIPPHENQPKTSGDILATVSVNPSGSELLKSCIDQDIPSFKNTIQQLHDLVFQYEEELQSTRVMLDKSESLARVGLHMGGVLHELNNLVGSMMGHAELAKLTGEEEDVTKCVDTALEATKRARILLRQIRGISRMKNTLDVMNVNETIDSIVHFLDPMIATKGIKLEKEVQQVPWIIGSAKAIRQAILLLTSSLLDTIPAGGSLVLSCNQVGSEICVGISEDRNRELEKVQLPLTPVLTSDKKTDLQQVPLDETRRTALDEMIEETKGRLECSCRTGKGYAYQILLPVNF